MPAPYSQSQPNNMVFASVRDGKTVLNGVAASSEALPLHEATVDALLANTTTRLFLRDGRTDAVNGGSSDVQGGTND